LRFWKVVAKISITGVVVARKGPPPVRITGSV